MKRYLVALLVGIMTVFMLVGVVAAEVNAVTPSTNDINRTNGWAHVNQLTQEAGEAELEFVSTRSFASCFEYRTDGDTSQVIGVNFNNEITDGLYPFVCELNSSRTMTIQANEYIEVRMVFGAEKDERFDWTRFDVLPNEPQSKEDCMNGGWETFGFKNQGLCIQFVNTGKDSR